MKKRYDVTALGELLIDFTECGLSPAGVRLFEQNPGGAPANVLCAVTRLGGSAAFIGKVGDDMHGRFLRETLEREGIDVSGLTEDPAVFTTLAFVGLSAGGERSFSFARKPGADTCLRPEEVSEALLRESAIFHVGSLSLTDEPARSATLTAVGRARELGAIVSYDPNYRASLWPDVETAKEQMRALVPLTDVMKLSDEEAGLLTGYEDPARCAQALLAQGPGCVAVTLGSEGALVATGEGTRRVSPFHVTAADATGAGDAFWGAFLSRLSANGKRPNQLTLDEAYEFARLANAAAALCVERRGAIPAMPTLAEVERRLNA
ncbi:putative fructokinase-4 [uncultured Eubacteriales bacterium]|uniref:Putative fructokinase-4 n=1 Tax=uncultured Eubacteriales bacterium TaxID=172733 RepID=A0A212J696_9FIRM|nr:putative fructokinase-4 [uncultured Eubacteriales bacterium]